MALIARLLAPGLFGAEMEDAGQQVALFPEEEKAMAGAGAKRRRDFALGRSCARAALSQLGHAHAAIGRDGKGAPQWPAGVIGSITHTTGYAAAIAADARKFGGLGVDAERIGGVTRNLWPRLFDAEECSHLEGLGAEAQARAATLFFSAKEACHKAWGVTSALVFREIHIAPQAGGFTATRSGDVLAGRYAVEGDLMLTVVWS